MFTNVSGFCAFAGCMMDANGAMAWILLFSAARDTVEIPLGGGLLRVNRANSIELKQY